MRARGGLRTYKDIYYLITQRVPSAWPKERTVLDKESVKGMVHTVARLHEVGRRRKVIHRPFFNPRHMCEGCFEVIKRSGLLPQELESLYQNVLEKFISVTGQLPEVPLQRIHGDTYSGNVIWSPEGPVYMDLDDFQVGPVALDLNLLSFPWRLDSLSEEMDRRERRKIQHELVLELYREIGNFPKEQEKIFPFLSFYRDIQFDAWFCARWKDPGFAQLYSDDDITDSQWWKNNIEGLQQLLG